MASNCVNCGCPLIDRAKFCPKCGAKVVVQTIPPPIQQPVQPTVQNTVPKSKPKKKKTWLIVLLIILLIAGLATTALLYFKPFDKNDDSLWQVNVPNVVDSSYNDALDTLRENSLHGLIYDKVNDESTVDNVVSQSPEKETLVSKGSIVDLTLSAGKEKGFLLDVENFNSDDAEKLLKDAGFTVKTEEDDDESYAPNAVKSQSVSSGYTEKGQEIVLKVTPSKTAGTETVTVPDIVGMDFDTAKAELKKVGLYLSKNALQYSDSVSENLIMKQSKAPKSEAKKGETVFVTVSLGEEKVYVPDITYRTEQKATEMLNNLGLKVNVKYEESKTVAKGTVISQETASGSPVKKGSEITFTVSTGYQVTVPDVTGMNEKDAVEELLKAELAVIVYEKEDKSVSKGNVISQDIEADKKVQLGTVVMIYVSGKSESGNNEETTKNEKGGTQQEKQAKIKFASPDVGYNFFENLIVSCNDVDYYICNGSLFASSQSGEVVLSDENCNFFIIVNDIIYYTTIDDQKDLSNLNLGDTLADFATTSIRRMKLDGSEKEHIYSFSGIGKPIFADDDDIYYMNIDVYEAVDDSAGYSLHRYSIGDKKDYPIESKQKYDNFVYSNGYIYYCEHSWVSDYSGGQLFKYEISSQTVTPLIENAKSCIRFGEENVIVLVHRMNYDYSTVVTDIHIYNTSDGSHNMKTYDYLATNFLIGHDGKVLLRKYGDDYSYYSLDKNLNLKEIISKSYFDHETLVDGGMMYLNNDDSDNNILNIWYYDFSTGSSNIIYSYTIDNVYLKYMNKNMAVFLDSYTSEEFTVKF